MNFEVKYGGGEQTVRTLAFGLDGQPRVVSEASFRILDLLRSETDPLREVVSETEATPDDAATTSSEAFGSNTADRRQIPVDDESDFHPGRRYLVTDAATGRTAVVEVERVAEGVLYLRSGLVASFADESTIEGLEIPCTIPSSITDDEDRLLRGEQYAIEWTYDIEPANQRDILRVSRSAGIRFVVTLDDCDTVDPTLRTQLANLNGAAEKFLVQAHRDWHGALAGLDIDPGSVHGGHNHAEYIKYRWAYHGRTHLRGDEGGHNDRLAQAHERQAAYLFKTFRAGGHAPHGTVIVDQDRGTQRAAERKLFKLS